MKKQFFYAAFALAMMASCTSEDNLSVDPIIPDDDDKVAIQLGIDAPTVSTTVGGRSVGSVGDVKDAENTAAEDRKNVWNGQQLYIAMVKKDTKELATDGTNIILDYDSYVYYAPRRSENANSGSIRFYTETNKPQTNGGNGEGTLSYVYYPVSGQYDFYGYHVDDITGVDNTDVTNIKDIIITGQQDIMGARTKEFTSTNYTPNQGVDFNDMIGWDFSARTARNGIKPILKFEHQLARLKFFVKAGSDKTAEYKYVNGSWEKNEATTGVSTAMKVKSIKAKNMVNKIDMNLNDNGKIVTSISGTTASYATDGFSLLSRENGTMKTTLDAVAPLVYDGTGTAADNSEVVPASNEQAAITYADYKNGTQVGESIMFFPYNGGEGKNTTQAVELEVELAQLVQILDNEASSDYQESEWTEKTQTAKLTIHASSLINQTDGAAKLFEPGKSYNVYITIYGFERIEITAELTAWENGGDVNVDVEEEQSRHNVDVTFKLQTPNAEGTGFTPVTGATINAPYTYKDASGASQSGDATFAETETPGTYKATGIPSFAVLEYTIAAANYENATGYLNARNGQEVTITMKAAGSTPAPANKTVTFDIPDGATLSWSYGDDETGSVTTIDNVPVGTVITYSVTKEYFTSVEDQTYTVLADGENTINVTLDYETVEKTFIITNLPEGVTATISINSGGAVTYGHNDGVGTLIKVTPTAEGTIALAIVTSDGKKSGAASMTLEDLHNENSYEVSYEDFVTE